MSKHVPLPKAVQVAVFHRDLWLCRWCKRPVIFAPVMKYLKRELGESGVVGPQPAYYHAHWTREGAPLLDELGAVIDHVEAVAKGGLNDLDNLATACNKCNARKSDAAQHEVMKKLKPKPIKGKYGEPQNWDGLSSLFVMLARRAPATLTDTERNWLIALTAECQ